jgi:DNA polymerase-3 subunit gamma/tau
VVNAIADRDFDTLFDTVDEMVSASRDPAVFWQELIGYYRDMLVTKTTKDPSKYLDLTDSEHTALVAAAARFTKETMLFHIGLLEDALFAMQKSYAVKRTVAEITLVRLCDPALDTSVESVLTRLSRVEEQLLTGAFVQATPAQSPVAPSVNAVEPGFPDMPPMEEMLASEPLACEPPLDLWEPPVDTYAPAQMQAPTSAPVKREAPAVRRPTPTAPPPAPAAASKPAARPTPPPAPVETKRILRPIKTWTEAVDRVRDTSRMAASFLVSAKAYTTEDGRVVVKLESDFVRTMVSREGAPEALRAALAVCLGRKLGEGDVLYEVEETGKSEGSLIDLIIEAAEE